MSRIVLGNCIHCLLYCLWIGLPIYHTNAERHDKDTINIYAITTSFSVGESIARGHELAINTINENPSILSSYYINLTVLPSGDDSTNALLHALAISSEGADIDFGSHGDHDPNASISYNMPIVLGCDWSSLSTVTAPVLSAFSWSQISSSSTSVILSETSFGYFYRTIPDDNLQAHALIFLCQTFNWTQIGIIHVNDNYGVYLAVAISELATVNYIQVHSIAFERDEAPSYGNAVSSMREIGVYTMILISHGDDEIKQLFNDIQEQDMLRYPYYYVAVDGWLDAKIIQNFTTNYTDYEGIIGTLPWQPIILNETYYNDTTDHDNHDLRAMYSEAQSIYKNIEARYYKTYGNDSSDLNPFGSRLIYGYESAMVFIYILQKLEEKYTLRKVLRNEHFDMIGNISDIILKDIEYFGVTGPVAFDQNTGDRLHGFYSFGYITKSGQIDLFGYSYFDPNHTVNGTNGLEHRFKGVIDADLIVWPDAFVSEGVVPPRSSPYTQYEAITIDHDVFVAMVIIASIGIASMLCYIVFHITYNAEGRRSNFELDLIIYIGAVLAYTFVILIGLDEATADSKTLNILCNVTLPVVAIAFTLCFVPLFLKTYKLSRIFTELLITKSVPDGALLVRVLVAVCVDVALLCIFLSLSPRERVWYSGDTMEIDEIHSTQYVYSRCTGSNDTINILFSVCLGVWKAMQMIFGLYVSMIVSRVSFKSQLRTVLVICVAITIAICLEIFGPAENPNFRYVVVTILIVFVVNVIVLQPWCKKMRIKCDLKINEDTRYSEEDIELDDETKMKQLLKSRLQEMARAENWAKAVSMETTASESVSLTGSTNQS
eukprot:39982_1